MKLHTVLILIFTAFSAAAHRDALKNRAGIPSIDPPTDPTTTGTTTTGTVTSTSNTSTGTSDTSTTSGSSASTTSTPTQGLPSVTGPSLSQSSSTTALQTSSSIPTDSTSTAFVTVPPSDSSTPTLSTTSAAPTNTDDGNNGDSSSVGTGTIVGLSVAGGVAVLGAVAFIIWKLTRKRFSEFDADGEEIKWPELGHESHALPTRQTGRAGVDDDGYDEAGIGGAGRRMGNYTPSVTTGETSMADLHSYNDPYAVPPLPHLDPNQPYHDDPANYGGHYDPYQGPIPQSFHEAASTDRIRTRSPAPGRQSPGPSLAYQGY